MLLSNTIVVKYWFICQAEPGQDSLGVGSSQIGERGLNAYVFVIFTTVWNTDRIQFKADGKTNEQYQVANKSSNQ